MADIVIAEFMDEASVHRLQTKTSVLYEPGLFDHPDDLRAALGSARALIVRNRTQVRATLLEAGPKLQLVGRLGVGLDNIDLAACASRNISVYPATGANDAAVAEYVVCTAMMLLRGAYRNTAAVAAELWPRERLIGREIAGKRAGLVGFGSTARQTASRLGALGMRLYAADPFLPASHPAWQTAERLDLNEIFATCDVISLHVPLLAQTRHLVNRETLALMKPSAILINAARGGVVDEAALADSLRAGQIAGAALDVFENEPLDSAHGAL
ncbi:MAG: 3-phosphoglycerate dehydrogenase, partial [Acidocella sp. 20-61-6]